MADASRPGRPGKLRQQPRGRIRGPERATVAIGGGIAWVVRKRKSATRERQRTLQAAQHAAEQTEQNLRAELKEAHRAEIDGLKTQLSEKIRTIDAQQAHITQLLDRLIQQGQSDD